MPTRRNHSSPRGMNTQRDRGRRKKDHRTSRSRQGEHDLEQDNFTFFESWLLEEFVDESGAPIEPSQSFGFKSFLQNTAKSELSPDEKLRILAIHWEDECVSMEQPKGWNILKRVYNEAFKYDSTRGTLFHSMSLSARACAYWIDDSYPQRDIIYKEARSLCREGLAIEPKNATIHLSIGRCEYDMGDSEKALIHFKNAIENDAEQMWAVLYQAHCLHDLERWQDASLAYEAVDLSFFNGHLQWRADLMRHQLAECYLRSGKREKALTEFLAILSRHEANEGTFASPDYLVRAAKGELRDDIAPRTIALLKKEQFFDEAQSIEGSKASD